MSQPDQDDVLAQNQQLRGELEAVRTALADQATQLDHARAEAQANLAARQTAESSLATVTRERDELQAKTTDLNAQADKLRTENAGNLAQVEKVRAENTALTLRMADFEQAVGRKIVELGFAPQPLPAPATPSTPASLTDECRARLGR